MAETVKVEVKKETPAANEEEDMEKLMTEVDKAIADGEEEEAAPKENGDAEVKKEVEEEKQEEEVVDADELSKELMESVEEATAGIETKEPESEVRKPLLKTLYAQDVKNDMDSNFRADCVIVSPLLPTDSIPESIMSLYPKCSEFSIRYLRPTKPDKEISGYLCLRFWRHEDAAAIHEKTDLWPEKEDLKITHLKPAARVFESPDLQTHRDRTKKINVHKDLLILEPLPDSLTEEKLAELFTDASYVFIARDNENKSKGYAYIEYRSQDEAIAAETKYKEGVEYEELKLVPVRIPTYISLIQEFKRRELEKGATPQDIRPVMSPKEITEELAKVAELKTKIKEAEDKEDKLTAEKLNDELVNTRKKLNDDRLDRVHNSKQRKEAEVRKAQMQSRKRTRPGSEQGGSGAKRGRGRGGFRGAPFNRMPGNMDSRGFQGHRGRGGPRGGRGGGMGGPNPDAAHIMAGISQLLNQVQGPQYGDYDGRRDFNPRGDFDFRSPPTRGGKYYGRPPRRGGRGQFR